MKAQATAVRVLLYPEKIYAQLGDVRYLLSTEVVRPECIGKDEIDIDSDLITKSWAFTSEEKARERAATILERDDLAFGAVTLQKQIVDWFVQEDNVAEWSDAGESEEITK